METDQHLQVMGNQGEIQCPVIECSDSTDPYEESPLLIDLGEDMTFDDIKDWMKIVVDEIRGTNF